MKNDQISEKRAHPFGQYMSSPMFGDDMGMTGMTWGRHMSFNSDSIRFLPLLSTGLTLTLGGTCGTGGAGRLLLLLPYTLLCGTTGALYIGADVLTVVVLLVEAVAELDLCILSSMHCLP